VIPRNVFPPGLKLYVNLGVQSSAELDAVFLGEGYRLKIKVSPALIILLLFGLAFFAAGCAALSLLDNFNTVQAKWADEDLAILYLKGWEDPEEAYESLEDYHLLKSYSEEDGLTTLVESNEQIFLLGTAEGEVHYLQPAPEGDWRWLTTTLD